MMPLALSPSPGYPLRILALGAHSDDIEIGCGGTLLWALDNLPRVEITWVVLGAGGERAREAQRSARAFLRKGQGSEVIVRGFRDGFLPFHGAEVKEFFEILKQKISPDLIFTHRLDDRHQDHRLVADLTWNTWRDHLILEYEIPKYDGDFISPNLYVPLSRAISSSKIRLLMKHFRTQTRKHWFSDELFWGLLRLRGMESGTASEYAEAFVARKWVLGTVAKRRVPKAKPRRTTRLRRRGS